MTPTPAETIDMFYRRLRAGDTDHLLSLLSEDVLLVVPGPAGVGAAGSWHGLSGARECFRRLGQAHATLSVQFLDRIIDRDRVVSRLHVIGAAATGKRFESDVVHMFTVVNGRITRLLDFFDTAALVEAYRPSVQGVSA